MQAVFLLLLYNLRCVWAGTFLKAKAHIDLTLVNTRRPDWPAHATHMDSHARTLSCLIVQTFTRLQSYLFSIIKRSDGRCVDRWSSVPLCDICGCEDDE